MECINAFPLSDETLGFVLDDLADEETLQHLSKCPYCATRMDELRQFDASLHKQLHRINCPSAEALSDYDLGILDEMEANKVSEHLRECPSCRAELKMLHNFLALLPEETALASKIIPLRQPSRVLRPAQRIVGTNALKGSNDDKTENKHDVVAGSVHIFLESQARPTGYTVTGQVVDTESENVLETEWIGGIAQVFWNDELQLITILDDTADFRFEVPAVSSVALHISAQSGKLIIIDHLAL